MTAFVYEVNESLANGAHRQWVLRTIEQVHECLTAAWRKRHGAVAMTRGELIGEVCQLDGKWVWYLEVNPVCDK